MDTALDILGITGPIYLAIALGYVATRRGLFTQADMPVFGRFTIQIALPALLFNALSQRSVSEIFNLQYLGAYAAGSMLVMGCGLWWARKVQGHSWSYSSMMAMGMSCPNSGFVGYPIMLLTLGPVAGVALALNMIVENLFLIPLLLALADRDGSEARHAWGVLGQTLMGLLKNPMIWGIVGGFAWSLSGWQLPAPLARSVNLFAAASGALSLFVIGGSLVGLKVQGLHGTLSQITFGKLVLHPLAMAAMLFWVFPVADPSLRSAALISGALPMLGIYTILSQRHGHGATSAATLLVTTVASFFSLSALLWLLRHLPV
ncbi:AEC family transporter [Limnohabitans radicicola]|uniref:AEC family transporter n=1 Tax=Limnohabitans radicicola TaxID=2771427 RepID=A0A927FI95_9BURK|nr:AEC family transporter [Limnohabitans radicicola]MBD8050548.1 AEC family transporter [Limnohabitans radicicola]